MVSIIIPCFNSSRWLKECLSSAAGQTYKNIEIIVVDDGSTDESRTIIENFQASDARFKYFYKSNGGHSSARNYGMQKSSGDFYLFLDADDILETDAIEGLLNQMVKNNADGVLGDWIDFKENGTEILQSTEFEVPEDGLASWILKGNVVSAALIKKNIYRWNESLKVNEGVYYFFDYFSENTKMVHLPKVVTRIRQHTSPNRVTVMHKHFHPLERFEMYLHFKRTLAEKKALNFHRKAALDYHMLTYLYQAKMQKIKFSNSLYAELPDMNLKKIKRYHRFGLSGFAQFLGPKNGLRLFYYINSLLGRL
jgi:glycosyltransferase involved in cell wall biosynthesis